MRWLEKVLLSHLPLEPEALRRNQWYRDQGESVPDRSCSKWNAQRWARTWSVQEIERQEWLGEWGTLRWERGEWEGYVPQPDRPGHLAGFYCDYNEKLVKVSLQEFHPDLHVKKTLLAGKPTSKLLRWFQERAGGGLDGALGSENRDTPMKDRQFSWSSFIAALSETSFHMYSHVPLSGPHLPPLPSQKPPAIPSHHFASRLQTSWFILFPNLVSICLCLQDSVNIP